MGNKLSLTPGFCFLGALCLLILPLRWSTGALLAALVHELAHCILIYICQGQIFSVTLGRQGTVMDVSSMGPGREVLCALAGPVGSFCVILLGNIFPEAAVCALVQGIYNLLPFYPLDGGRILRILFPERLYLAAESFFLVLLAGFALWIMTLNREVGGMIFLFLCFPLIWGKIACKESKQRVQ